MEKDLEQAREDMHNISEEQEAHNEELQSANEELLSSNEEMQSLNEEMESSKEELQSTNEELIVINRELLDKHEELNETLDDLDAVIATMREPFLILYKDMRILKTNLAYLKRFVISETKVEGKEFFEIQDGQWNHIAMSSLLEKVLPGNQRITDKELVINHKTDGEHNFLFNAREIFRTDGSGKRILLAIADITMRKKVAHDYLTTIEELGRINQQLD